jgi:glycine C-acetyltransferase
LTADSSFQRFLVSELREIRSHAPIVRIIDGPQAHTVRIDGREVLMLSSNNYLGLTNHPKVLKATRDAIDRYGVGLGCGRSIVSMRIQLELEKRIADFKKTQASLVFPTGYDTNLGAVWSLTGPDTTLFLDEYNHASVFDGAKLSHANLRTYPHGDMGKLESLLLAPDSGRMRFVVTPSIFPLEGDIARLPEIVGLAEKHNASVYVDDAHAVGNLGSHGRGSADHFGLHGKIAIQVGTLSKALASVGGYVAGTDELREFLFSRARPFAISTGHIAPPSAAAALAALEILEEDDSLVKRLWKNAAYFRDGLHDLGFDTGRSETPIIPVMVKDPAKAVKLAKALFDLGVLVRAFTPPTVPENTARLRTIVSATHTDSELDTALEAFARAGRALKLIG